MVDLGRPKKYCICMYGYIKGNKVATTVYLGMCGFVALSTVAFAISGEWMSAFSSLCIFFMMLIPSFLKDKYRVHLPIELDITIVLFIFLSLFLGSLQGYYEKFAHWDKILHFKSGLLLAFLGFVVVYLMNEKRSGKFVLSPGFLALFSACFSMALSVIWEIYEYILDTFFGYNMQRDGINDTMIDLILNTAGAIIIAIGTYIWMKRREKIPFAPKILGKYTLE